jgi:hypothetical protein
VTVVNETLEHDQLHREQGPGEQRGVPLGTSGEIGVRCDMPPGSTGQADFLFDVTGYFE